MQQEPDLLSVLAKSFSEDTEDNRNIVLEVLEVLPDLMTEDKIVIEDEIRQGFIEFAALLRIKLRFIFCNKCIVFEC